MPVLRQAETRVSSVLSDEFAVRPLGETAFPRGWPPPAFSSDARACRVVGSAQDERTAQYGSADVEARLGAGALLESAHCMATLASLERAPFTQPATSMQSENSQKVKGDGVGS